MLMKSSRYFLKSAIEIFVEMNYESHMPNRIKLTIVCVIGK
jgi:hypothetical protein